LVLQLLESAQVALGNVHDMNVVPHLVEEKKFTMRHDTDTQENTRGTKSG
jgi:hypothetical protein